MPGQGEGQGAVGGTPQSWAERQEGAPEEHQAEPHTVGAER